MNSTELYKYKLRIKNSKDHELDSIVKEIISLGEFPKELGFEVIKILKRGKAPYNTPKI